MEFDFNFWGMACLVLGMILVGVEIFTPGFGIPGASGMVLLALCIVMTAKGWTEALIIATVIVAMICIMVIIAVRSVAKGRLSRSKIILNNSLTREEGFSAVANLDSLLGKEGVCATPLRPAGTVEIEGNKYDVVSDLGFIETGEAVVISAVEGRRVVARRIDKEEEEG